MVETLIDSTGIFGSLVVGGLDTAASEEIVIRVATDALPPVLGVLLVCGAAAIVVSTANSFLLTPSTNLIRDVYQRFINPGVTDVQVVRYTRFIVVGVGTLGYVAGTFFPTILAMALWAYTMYGAGITPALLGALLWKRATRLGGVLSILVGDGHDAGVGDHRPRAARRADGTPVYPFGWQTAYPALALSDRRSRRRQPGDAATNRGRSAVAYGALAACRT